VSRRVSEADYRALAAFRFALRQFVGFSEAAAAAAGLTPRQHQALLAVRGWAGPDPITIGGLAEQLQVQHHSAVGLVQRLVRQALLACRPSRRDRRRVTLRATARGRRVLAALASAHKAELRRRRPQLIALLESLGH
jgi:DNA-binding MarR family transcriptional regulator